MNFNDALLKLAAELEMAWNTAEEFDMDEFADKIRALAEQPAGVVGERPIAWEWKSPHYGVCYRFSDSFNTAFPNAPVDWTPAAASVDVEGLRAFLLRCKVPRRDYQYVIKPGELDALIDSAGGAKCGPDYSDGYDHEGFPGGDERMNPQPDGGAQGFNGDAIELRNLLDGAREKLSADEFEALSYMFREQDRVIEELQAKIELHNEATPRGGQESK